MIAAAGRSVDVPLLRRTIFPCRTAEDGTGLPVARPTGKACWTAIAIGGRPETGRILQQDPQLNPGRAGGRRAGDRHRGMRTPSRILSGRARRSEAMDDREPRPGIREQGWRSAKTDDQRRGRLFLVLVSRSGAVASTGGRKGGTCLRMGMLRGGRGWLRGGRVYGRCEQLSAEILEAAWRPGRRSAVPPELARSRIAPTSWRQALSPGADR